MLLNVGGAWPGDLDKIDAGSPRQIHLQRLPRTKPTARGRRTMSKKGFSPRQFDRVRDRRRAPAQRDEPRRRRSRGHPGQHLLRDEHDRKQQCRVLRALRGRDRPRTRPYHRRQGLEPARRAQLPAPGTPGTCSATWAFDHRYGRGLQPQPAALVQARASIPASRSCRAPTTSICS